jgi:hypothetical protein
MDFTAYQPIGKGYSHLFLYRDSITLALLITKSSSIS